MKMKLRGFKVRPVGAMVNGVWMKRPDVVSVSYAGHHIMTIPKKMYGFPNPDYRTLEGTEQPMFYDREYHLKNWKLLIERSPIIQERDRKEREILALEMKV